MNENRISIELSEADVAAINGAIQILADKLQPVLIALNAEDKKNLAKLGERSISFVVKTMQYIDSNPEFLPPFVSVVEVKKDFNGFNMLNSFLRPLRQIVGNLEDTTTLCGSETILASLVFYNSVKLASKMNAPNSSTIYDDLSQRFDGQKARRKTPEALKI